MPSTATELQGIATVMVPVHDQDAAIEYYCSKLGFSKGLDVPFGEGDQAGRWVEVTPPAGGPTIALTPHMEARQWTAGRMTGVSFSTDDAAAAQSALRERGVDVDEEIMGGEGPVPKMFWFRDLDANNFLLVQTGQPG